MMKLKHRMGGVLIAAGIGLATSGAALADDVCPKRGGTFRTVDMQYTRVDPTQAVNPLYLMDLVYDSLLRVEHDLTISPGLAEAMPEQVDDLNFIFKLRQGVKFHDGTDFNAEAVKFNVERQQSGDVVSPFTGIWKEFVKEVVVEDPHTVRFVLNRPWPGFLWETASYLRFASPTMVEELGEDYGVTDAAGTGPFMFDTFDPKKSLTLVRNPDYYRTGEPCVDRFEVSLVASGSVRILSLKAGDLDLINTFPESQFPQFEGEDDIIIEEGVATTFTLLPLNTRHPALGDIRVRQAIQHAIDGKVIIDNVYGGAGAEVESIFPPWHKGYVKADDLSPVERGRRVRRRERVVRVVHVVPGARVRRLGCLLADVAKLLLPHQVGVAEQRVRQGFGIIAIQVFPRRIERRMRVERVDRQHPRPVARFVDEPDRHFGAPCRLVQFRRNA